MASNSSISPMGGYGSGLLAPWIMQGGQNTQTGSQTNGINPTQQRTQKLEALKAKNYREIMAHEQAHASAAGNLAGSINIVNDANGIPVSGFVMIRIPGVNPSNPAESYSLAKQAYAGATAPGGDMSAADSSVASRAMSVMGQAQVLMNQQKQTNKAQ